MALPYIKTSEETFATTHLYRKTHSWKWQNGHGPVLALINIHGVCLC